MRDWLDYNSPGGGCTPSGTPVTGSLGPAIAAVRGAITAMMTAFANSGVGASTSASGGGKKKEDDEGGCEVTLAVVTSAPSGGHGTGTVKRVTFLTDGSWTANGESLKVIFPRI